MSVFVGVLAALLATVIGTVPGALAGFFGGRVGDFLEWLYSVFTAVPDILLIFAFAAVLGRGVDTVVVMRQGTLREQGPVAQIFSAPQDAYTRALLACRPSLSGTAARLVVMAEPIASASLADPAADPAARPATATAPAAAKDPAAPVVLEVRALAKSFFLKQGLLGRREFKAVQGVNFQLKRGHTRGVVGESGSGKTTMALTLLRLPEPTGGEVVEQASAAQILAAPQQDYTRRLLAAVPRGWLAPGR